MRMLKKNKKINKYNFIINSLPFIELGNDLHKFLQSSKFSYFITFSLILNF